MVYERAADLAIILARDDGTSARVIAHGNLPVISPDGRWVAYLVPTAKPPIRATSSATFG